MSHVHSLSKAQMGSFYGFTLLIILSCVSAAVFDQIFIALLPVAILFAYQALVNFKSIFFLFFLLLPFSIEVELPGGLGTDLPSEPLMWFLMITSFLLFLWNGKSMDTQLFKHRISIIVFLHVVWIGITILLSSFPVLSLKFFLAKLWYVIPFFFLPLMLLEKKDLKTVFNYLLVGTLVAVTYVMFRHALTGFSFEGINHAVRPIFRNHVNYASLLVLLLPFVWAMYNIEKKWYYGAAILYLLLATYLTYTRAAQGVVVLCVPMYLILRFRLIKWVTPLAFAVVIGLLVHMIKGNQYLSYAPDFEKTITHTKFDNLIEATYKMEDISTMERVYRWVAGFQMLKENPVFGFGPATFFSNYDHYTVSSFKTYVSDNPEKSGIHNYYLMTAVEQGFIGLVLVLLLILVPLFEAEKLFHSTKSKEDIYWIIAAGLSFFSTAVLITINDLIEADKVGPLFFLSAAILVMMSRGEGVKLEGS